MAGKPSKIIINGETKIDLTADTITKDKVLVGYSFHGPDGETYTGSCTFDANTQDATAAAAEILLGKIAYNKGVKVTGTMPNNGAVTYKIKTVNDKFTVPIGYHDGSGKIELDSTEVAKIIATNIRAGVQILGITGTMSTTEGAKAQSKTITPSFTQQTVLPDTQQGYNYLSQVIVAKIPVTETENSAGGMTITVG